MAESNRCGTINFILLYNLALCTNYRYYIFRYELIKSGVPKQWPVGQMYPTRPSHFASEDLLCTEKKVAKSCVPIFIAFLWTVNVVPNCRSPT